MAGQAASACYDTTGRRRRAALTYRASTRPEPPSTTSSATTSTPPRLGRRVKLAEKFKTLGYMTPSEAYTQILATTA
jgi:hypothetical protein